MASKPVIKPEPVDDSIYTSLEVSDPDSEAHIQVKIEPGIDNIKQESTYDGIHVKTEVQEESYQEAEPILASELAARSVDEPEPEPKLVVLTE